MSLHLSFSVRRIHIFHPSRFRLGSIVRKSITLGLAVAMFLAAVPPASAGLVLRGAIAASGKLTRNARASSDPARENIQERAMPPRQITPSVIPPPPPTKNEREARATSLLIKPGSDVLLGSREPMLFSAVPVDAQGNTVQGLQPVWESNNKQVIFVKKDGQAVAGKPGRAILTAQAGRVSQIVRVTVVEGSRETFGGTKKENSLQANTLTAKNSSYSKTKSESQHNKKRAHASMATQRSNLLSATATALAPIMPQRPPNEDPLPDNQTSSLYQALNIVGSPPGKTNPGALTKATATGGTESGNTNFSFGLPIVSLPGRGLDVSLDLVHNSQVWNKSTDPSDSSTWMTYDVDSGWPAPGFRLSFGQIENQGGAGFTLTDQDGTRHALVYSSANNYDTTDGSFIHFTGGSGWGTLYYPDGTQVSYGAAGGGYRSYPVKITDRNGNYILISYAGTNGVGPKISSIQDTLGRYVRFYYATNGDLVTITAPGLGTQSERQVMRFYYADVSISQTGLFGSGVNVTAPTTLHTLQYVYLSDSGDGSNAHIGYRFDHSAYGMMYQVKQFRGMTVSTNSTTSAGTVTEGTNTIAATTIYDYPTTASSLTGLPSFARRTDDWAGRTTGGSAPEYLFALSQGTNEKVSTVTAPDLTVTKTHSNDKPGQWDDGLVTDTYVQFGTAPTVLAHTKIDWDSTSTNNPRVSQVRTTDVPAGLTKATVLTYTTYNNVSAVSERAFTTNGTVSSTELRRTETTYLTSSAYVNRRLLHLPSSVKVFPGGSSIAAARVDYAYDQYGTSHANLTSRDDVIMHDPAFDPFHPANQESCIWVCVNWDYTESPKVCDQWDWFCVYTSPYVPATDARGNVTSVTTYPDAASTSNTIAHSTTYDIAGNVITAQNDCCQIKSYTYSSSYHYAYPESITNGNPSGLHTTTSTTYDFDTGLVGTTTDENNRVTTTSYNADSLRIGSVLSPNGGLTVFYYGDSLWADAAGRYHYYSMVSTQLSSTSGDWVDVYRFHDGLGAVAQTFYDGTGGGPWTLQITEYDNMGRAYRTTNPFYDAGYGGVLTGLWTTKSFDHLGRVTQVTMPTGDNANPTTGEVNIAYDGAFTTVTDQALKQRRQKVDELGRGIRLDEPTISGLGTTSSPNQPTSYVYDALNNLVHIDQGSQDRYFKYDSLSRMVRERQVEQETRSSYDLADSTNTSGSWSRKLVYNSSGLITEAHDARGVQTTLSYDDLNRITQISYSDSTPAAHYYYDSQTLPSGAPSYTHGDSTGRLLATTYGSGATGTYFGYDNMGRVVTQRQVTGSTPTTYSLSYTYNYVGMPTSATYPSNRTVSFAYGYAGKLSSVGDGTTTFANAFLYKPLGGLHSETLGNGMMHVVSYNHALQVSQVKLKQSSTGSELQRYDYWYGDVTQSNGSVDTTKNTGQIARIDGTINGATTKEWDQRFLYDELGRLKTAAEYQQGTGSTPTWQAKYTYDRHGNRLQSGSGDNFGVGFTPVTSSEIVNTTNRFIDSGSTPTTYDAAGNTLTDTKFRNLKYEYDANNRQTAVKLTNNTSVQSSIYDSAGQRVQTTAGTNTRTMVYDIFGQDVADYTGSGGGTLERENIYRGGQLLATYEASTSSLKYVLTDAQGSTRAVMNNSGGSSSVIARHDYLPFGEEIGSSIGLRSPGQGYGASDTNRRKYGLTERDDSSGLDHTWWRKYDSSSGRWTSPDPYRGSMTVSDPQSFNRYTYTQNDPVNFVDPTGLRFVRTCVTWSWFDVKDPRNPIEVGPRRDECTISWVNDYMFGSGSFLAREPTGRRPFSRIDRVYVLQGQSPQQGFDNCAADAWWEYRKGYFKESFRAVGGTALMAGGLYAMFRGIPGGGPGGGIGLEAAVTIGTYQGIEVRAHAGFLGAAAGLPVAILGGLMFAKSITESDKNTATIEAALEDCKDRFPSADHSRSFLNF